MDDTAAGIISPAATYPGVPALGFFVGVTRRDSLSMNQPDRSHRCISQLCEPVAIVPHKTSDTHWRNRPWNSLPSPFSFTSHDHRKSVLPSGTRHRED